MDKVNKGELLDFYADGDWHTQSDAAKYFNVSRETIKSRCKELANDGIVLVNSSLGTRAMRPGDVSTEDDAIIIEHMTRWMIGIVTRQAMSAKPMKKLMTEARKLLPKSDTERMAVRKYLVQLTNLIDWNDAAED